MVVFASAVMFHCYLVGISYWVVRLRCVHGRQGGGAPPFVADVVFIK